MHDQVITGASQMARPIVLSYVQTKRIYDARQKGQHFLEISPDLGITTVNAQITPTGVLFPNGEQLGWQSIEKINKSSVNCFLVENGDIKPIDPHEDTLRKIAAIAPVVGRVLDTATGLGYTAIEAAKTAQQVVTIELDLGAQEMARLNPWSQALFDNPRIQQVMGDAFEVVQDFEDRSFARIIHDPPKLSLAGDLYAGEFYRQLFRILERGGRLFHYVGDPNSKASGSVTRGVLRRLQEAGFARVARKPEAYGVVAYK